MSAQLGNKTHEKFAQLVAAGGKQKESYAACGYTPSAPHASKLANRPDVKARIAEIRAQAMNDFFADDANTFEDLGVTPEWITEQYRQILIACHEWKDFKTADKVLSLMYKMLKKEEDAADAPATAPATAPAKIDINALGETMDKLLGAAMAPSPQIDHTPTPLQIGKAHRAADNET